MPRHILPPTQSAGTPRFILHGPDLAEDAATGLFWPRSANILGYGLPWDEALAAVAGLNRENHLGHADWRMPNRRELRSLVDHGNRQPALPAGHPFRDVFLGWCWTSTTKAGQPAYAWNVHFEGGRMFYSRKDEFRLLWPVRGASALLPQTGQVSCYDDAGLATPCAGSGQDGELRAGAPWPAPRFEPVAEGMLDLLTGLCWQRPAGLDARNLTWEQALALGGHGWRLPDINELESLVDAQRAEPALPAALERTEAWPEGFWSATTSGFDPAWAFVLYARKGAVGVGFKTGGEFAAWLVREAG